MAKHYVKLWSGNFYVEVKYNCEPSKRKISTKKYGTRNVLHKNSYRYLILQRKNLLKKHLNLILNQETSI